MGQRPFSPPFYCYTVASWSTKFGNRYLEERELMKARFLTFLLWLTVGSVGLSACNGQPAVTEPPPETADTSVEMVETEAATAVASPTTPHAEPIDDGDVIDVMYTLSDDPPARVRDALARVVATNDQRFIPVLIELYRFNQLGLVGTFPREEYIDALESLTGQTFGLSWPAWVEWYGHTDLEPPPGFASWKGRKLVLIDPGFGEFLRSDHPSRIRIEEIQWGGVVVDGIPALDNPAMLTAAEADYLDSGDAVFGIYINGEARAYPLRILDWHEMANDVVGGVPVSLAYCTLCGAAIAYDGRGPDGTTYTFSSSGFLYRSNKLMYDRQTRTLWNQLTGEPVLGRLADQEDLLLNLLPVVLTTWAEWQTRHPDTLVVDVNTGFARDYRAGAAYGDYFSAAETMFPVWQRSDLLDTKEQIYAVRIDGIPKAYPIQALIEAAVLNDGIIMGDGSETAVVLIAPRDQILIDGQSRRAGSVSYSPGAEVRAYERGSHTFSSGPDDQTLLDENGRVWQIGEEALTGPDEETLARLDGHLAYWFGWFAFFPNSQVYLQP
jgi:hypothetical protein